MLGRWFAAHTISEAASALAGTSVPWERYRTFTELAAGLGGHPLMREIDQPGAGRHLAPGSPLSVDGRVSPAVPAPVLGEHTRAILGTED